MIHGCCFGFVVLDQDLDFVLKVFEGRCELKNRGRLGRERGVCEEDGHARSSDEDHGRGKDRGGGRGTIIPSRSTSAQMSHRRYGRRADTRRTGTTGHQAVESEEVDLTKGESRACRMLTARLNYMAQGTP